jgi:hypothetical protein
MSVSGHGFRSVRFSVALLLCGSAQASLHAQKPEVPNLSIQASLESDSLHPAARGACNVDDCRLRLTVLVKNDSQQDVRDLSFHLSPELKGIDLESADPAALKPLAMPYFSRYAMVYTLTASSDAAKEFGRHKMMLVADYSWKDQNGQHTTAISAPIEFTIDREFEEEAKSLPGGSAAMLYLLLPFVAIFLSYSFFENARCHEPFKVPEFKTSYIAPIFLGSILVNLVVQRLFLPRIDFSYADPSTISKLIVGCIALGALKPSIHWLWQIAHSFKESDNDVQYARKLLRYARDGCLDWCEVEDNKKSRYKGFLLKQPDGSFGMGALLQVSSKDSKCQAKLAACFNTDREIVDRKSLQRLLKLACISLTSNDQIDVRGSRITGTFYALEKEAPHIISSTPKPVLYN